jgi:hypothetical protein
MRPHARVPLSPRRPGAPARGGGAGAGHRVRERGIDAQPACDLGGSWARRAAHARVAKRDRAGRPERRGDVLVRRGDHLLERGSRGDRRVGPRERVSHRPRRRRARATASVACKRARGQPARRVGGRRRGGPAVRRGDPGARGELAPRSRRPARGRARRRAGAPPPGARAAGSRCALSPTAARRRCPRAASRPAATTQDDWRDAPLHRQLWHRSCAVPAGTCAGRPDRTCTVRDRAACGPVFLEIWTSFRPAGPTAKRCVRDRPGPDRPPRQQGSWVA